MLAIWTWIGLDALSLRMTALSPEQMQLLARKCVDSGQADSLLRM
jgi:hypothetical protein